MFRLFFPLTAVAQLAATFGVVWLVRALLSA
jgi:hypothetical protein